MHQVAALKPDRIAFYSYAHVPWLKPGQRRFTENDLPDTFKKNKLHDVGQGLLTYFGYKQIGMDHFALPGDELLFAETEGTLHRNFMGYTTQHTQLSIGLGVSSISDSWYAFAQNVKTVEQYTKLVNEGQLPIFKGHILTDDDLVIRKHILNIMCKGYTSWNPRKEPSLIVLEGIERLYPLEDDGLIEINSMGIEVTTLGKRFLRNICMCLDVRLWADKPTTPLFSTCV